MDRSKASYERPLLNQGVPYVPDAGRTREDDIAQIWDAASDLKKYRTKMSDNDFDKIYMSTMQFYRETELLNYERWQKGELKKEEFYKECSARLKKEFPVQMENENDFNIMMRRINTAMFGYDVLQPLIDNPDTSDIKVCGPYDIRVRVQGKAYKSNASFINDYDLAAFIKGLGLRNGKDILKFPCLTFTDMHDQNYILRFTISAPYVTAYGYPYLHIRKVPKNKPDFDELIRRGMLNEDIKLYLIDRAKAARAVVFAGPPGSGKSTALNAWIEYIPKTRETLVIQENDELNTQQSGFMFKHPSLGLSGEPVCTLEDLGRMALVEGCNEFIVGEVKGGEMRYVMTLLNAGSYAALTVHSTNAYETLDKLADLVKYGSSYSFDEAKRMLKTVDTIVYMQDYKIQEILECVGYDDETKQFQYINIYRRSAGTPENTDVQNVREHNAETPSQTRQRIF